jgi:hypothetical protein
LFHVVKRTAEINSEHFRGFIFEITLWANSLHYYNQVCYNYDRKAYHRDLLSIFEKEGQRSCGSEMVLP